MVFDTAVDRAAALLKKLREERRVSQRVLADFARVRPSVVSRAERGGDAKLGNWDRMFAALGHRLLFDTTETSEEAEDLLREEDLRRRERRREGFLARYGRRYRNISPP